MTDKYVGNLTVAYYSQGEDFLIREGSLQQAQITKWRDNLCGLMCVAMIINRFNQDSKHTLLQLINTAEKLGAFEPKRGWVHKKIVTLAENYNIKAYTQRAVDLDTVHELLAAGDLIIASVAPYYLNPELKENKDEKSGHLVVITGMSSGNTGRKIFINDPGSEYADGGQNKEINSTLLEPSFSGNIIVFKNPQRI